MASEELCVLSLTVHHAPKQWGYDKNQMI